MDKINQLTNCCSLQTAVQRTYVCQCRLSAAAAATEATRNRVVMYRAIFRTEVQLDTVLVLQSNIQQLLAINILARSYIGRVDCSTADAIQFNSGAIKHLFIYFKQQHWQQLANKIQHGKPSQLANNDKFLQINHRQGEGGDFQSRTNTYTQPPVPVPVLVSSLPSRPADIQSVTHSLTNPGHWSVTQLCPTYSHIYLVEVVLAVEGK